MATNTLEQRIASLEREVLSLKQHLPSAGAVPWWEQISGAFAEEPAFVEATDLGRQYREAQRPATDEDADVPA
jgi:hypothetical protein